MRRIAMLMLVGVALMALGSFSPFGAQWGHPAVAEEGGDEGSGDEDGDGD